jgi:tricorn protease
MPRLFSGRMNVAPLTMALIAALAVAITAPNLVSAQGTRLLRHPDVSRDAVVFAQGGDLWIAPRSGGAARRLTATPDGRR